MDDKQVPVLRLERVGYDYHNGSQRFRALSDVSFSVSRGEFVAIVGASGSGKTTLMNLMGLMATVTEGSLELMGREVRGLDEADLAALRNRHLGFVFQEYHLLPRLSVLENVLLPSLYAPESQRVHFRRRAMPLLKKLGVADQARKRPDALSGGQKQRVAICRALINEPALILADEPTGALDSKTSHDLLDLLDALHREGATIVMVTHDPQVAARASRIITIEDGRIAQDSGPRAAAAAPRLSVDPATPRWGGVFPFLGGLRESSLGALRTFSSAKLRTALTLLGLVVGVFCVSTILGAAGELQRSLNGFIKNIGLTSVFINAAWDPKESPGLALWRGFPVERTQRFFNALLGDRFEMEAHVWASFEISLNEGASSKEVTATSPQTIEQFRRLNVTHLSGRSLDERDFDEGGVGGRSGVFLSSARCERLFSKESCLRGKGASLVGTPLNIRWGEHRFFAPILGFFEVNRDSHFSIQDGGGTILLSPSLARRLGLFENSWFLSITPKHAEISTATSRFVRNFFDSYFNGYIRFNTQDLSENIATVKNVLVGVAAFFSLVAALSILVGGINVMNIMLVTVVERTREIGLRKAVGAPPSAIRRQFLTEAVLLCCAGGLVGVGVAVAAMNGLLYVLASHSGGFLKSYFLVDRLALGVGLATSLATGLVFGIFPAFKASRLDVVDAIRKEG